MSHLINTKLRQAFINSLLGSSITVAFSICQRLVNAVFRLLCDGVWRRFFIPATYGFINIGHNAILLSYSAHRDTPPD